MAVSNFSWIESINPTQCGGVRRSAKSPRLRGGSYDSKLGSFWRAKHSAPSHYNHKVVGSFKKTERNRIRQAVAIAKAKGMVWDAERGTFVPDNAPRMGRAR